MKKALHTVALATVALVCVIGGLGSAAVAQTYTPRGYTVQYVHPRTGQPINNDRYTDHCHQQVYYTQPTGPTCAQPVYYAAPMDGYQFQSALAHLRSLSFESTRQSVARQILDQNWVTAAQMREIVASFTFESGKLDIAKYGYHRTLDPQNYYVVYSAFTFESSVREMVRYTSGH